MDSANSKPDTIIQNKYNGNLLKMTKKHAVECQNKEINSKHGANKETIQSLKHPNRKTNATLHIHSTTKVRNVKKMTYLQTISCLVSLSGQKWSCPTSHPLRHPENFRCVLDMLCFSVAFVFWLCVFSALHCFCICSVFVVMDLCFMNLCGVSLLFW